MIDPLGLFEYRVVLHVHSSFSDGSGTVPEIIREAQGAGLDVLWLTDHETRKALKTPGAGFYGHLLFLVGAEITPAQNHYLVFGGTALADPNEPLQRIIDRIKEDGGLGFIAHPDDAGNPTLRLKSYRWSDRAVSGFTGLEVWNHLSQWSQKIHNVPSGLWALLHPYGGMAEAPPETLAIWDERGQSTRVVGIGGVDAHAAKLGRKPLTVTVHPYRTAFGTIRTHLYTQAPLPSDWRAAEESLLDALKNGRAAIVNAAWGQELGFRFWAQNVEGAVIPMGGECLFQPHYYRLSALAPIPVEWGVHCNNRLVGIVEGTLLEWPVDSAGVWRLVLRRNPRRRVWIYSNPIYIR